MKSIRLFIKDLLPPVITRAISRFRSRQIPLKGPYSSWVKAAEECNGYADQSILAKVLNSTLKVKSGEAAYERDSVVFDTVEYSWPVTAGLMWTAAQSGGRLNVLDFGGALGSSYFQNRSFFKGLSQVEWSVIEQEHYVVAGRKHIQEEGLQFYSSIDECLSKHQPTIALFSSVFQYLPEIDSVIEQIINTSVSVIIIDRTPIMKGLEDKVFVQTVPGHIYAGSYPIRIFSSPRLLKKFVNWHVVAISASNIDAWMVADDSGIEFQSIILQRNPIGYVDDKLHQ
jgi:putative methyltransferase (TIGR04325 family)